MTKVDKDNFDKKVQLPVEFNDAHAALRGFANSTLNSSVVLSAGMNPRLYSYFETFPDFFPNENSELKKKIILKVERFPFGDDSGQLFSKKRLVGFRIPHRIGFKLWWTRVCHRRLFIRSDFGRIQTEKRKSDCFGTRIILQSVTTKKPSRTGNTTGTENHGTRRMQEQLKNTNSYWIFTKPILWVGARRSFWFRKRLRRITIPVNCWPKLKKTICI